MEIYERSAGDNAGSGINRIGQSLVEKAGLQNAIGAEVMLHENVVVLPFGGLQRRIPNYHRGRSEVRIYLLRGHDI